jgi:phospholipid/cholesterol/gamma-HCH transport system substrate-binding protein
MLQSLARLGDVGTRVIQQASANTVADLQLLQPILTQLAAAGPNLTGSLELLLTYPFPDSSLTALNYREAQTGGYALFTNMTATVDFNLSQLLCRYAVDPTSGALQTLPVDTQPKDCGIPGTPPGNGAGSTSGAKRSAASTNPTLPGNIVGHVPSANTSKGALGLPAVPGVTTP